MTLKIEMLMAEDAYEMEHKKFNCEHIEKNYKSNKLNEPIYSCKTEHSTDPISVLTTSLSSFLLSPHAR